MDTKPPTQIHQAILQAKAEAQPYLHDEKSLAALLDTAAANARQSHDFLLQCWESLQILLRMLRARVAGKYSPPASVIAMSIAAILYFLNPVDLIPDSIPVLGFVDDVAVISFIARANRSAIRNFLQWELYFGREFTPYWKRSPAHP